MLFHCVPRRTGGDRDEGGAVGTTAERSRVELEGQVRCNENIECFRAPQTRALRRRFVGPLIATFDACSVRSSLLLFEGSEMTFGGSNQSKLRR